jgi:predicted RNase H-like HicB family nuclease
MLTEFIAKQLKRAHYKLLKDGAYFGEIPGLKGVWANSKSLEVCRERLRSALEDWVLFKLKDGDTIPGLQIGVDKRRLVKTPQHAR